MTTDSHKYHTTFNKKDKKQAHDEFLDFLQPEYSP